MKHSLLKKATKKTYTVTPMGSLAAALGEELSKPSKLTVDMPESGFNYTRFLTALERHLGFVDGEGPEGIELGAVDWNDTCGPVYGFVSTDDEDLVGFEEVSLMDLPDEVVLKRFKEKKGQVKQAFHDNPIHFDQDFGFVSVGGTRCPVKGEITYMDCEDPDHGADIEYAFYSADAWIDLSPVLGSKFNRLVICDTSGEDLISVEDHPTTIVYERRLRTQGPPSKDLMWFGRHVLGQIEDNLTQELIYKAFEYSYGLSREDLFMALDDDAVLKFQGWLNSLKG